jgi:hypothetical protein
MSLPAGREWRSRIGVPPDVNVTAQSTRGWRFAVIGVLAFTGVALVVWGLIPRAPEDGPLPAHTFGPASVAASGSASPAELPPPASTASVGPLSADSLVVPSLSINAPLVSERAPEGSLEIPGDPSRLALAVDSAPLSASAGTTIIAGHVSNDGKLGAFSTLSTITANAEVMIADAQGHPYYFTTIALSVVSVHDLATWLPPDLLSGPRQVLLVTCGGPLTKGSDGLYHYVYRVIATLRPATPGS